MLHALLAQAKAEGWTAEQVLAEAERAGAPITDEGYLAFVREVTGG